MSSSRSQGQKVRGLGLRLAVCSLLSLSAIAAPELLRMVRAVQVLAELMRPSAGQARSAITRGSELQSHTFDLRLPGRSLPIHARSYAPASQRGNAAVPTLVLLHGAHPRGIDEPRLTSFARSLARAGITVLTPELPELMAYRIEGSTIESIAEIAHARARASRVPAVGVMGISFAGSLALLAAANARHAEAIAFVVAVGAHHDLARLTRYYAGQQVEGPGGEPSRVAPHPYGARVLLREHLDRFFSASDLPLARAALDTYLRDQHTAARRAAERLTPEGQRIMHVLLDHQRSPELSRMLLDAADAAKDALAEASPRARLSRLSAPAFLVHGADDPIIPSIETLWLARELPARLPRRVVVTPLLRHAEADRPPSLRESLQLVSFMASILRATDAERFSRPARTTRGR